MTDIYKLCEHGQVNLEGHFLRQIQKAISTESTDFYYTISPRYGNTLAQKHNESKLSDESILQVGIQLLDQLEAIHSAGYVHCDIKPDNITIGQDPFSKDQTMRARLIDFGLSQSYLKDDQSHITK